MRGSGVELYRTGWFGWDGQVDAYKCWGSCFASLKTRRDGNERKYNNENERIITKQLQRTDLTMSAGEVNIHSIPRSKVASAFGSEPVPQSEENLPAKLNVHSSFLTEDPSRGGVQAYMYALGLSPEDLHKAQVCIASVWFEGNPCNTHLNDFGKIVKKGVQDAGMIGFQTATVGVR
jgi:hypothetical protein